jgi:hypothetical protein
LILGSGCFPSRPPAKETPAGAGKAKERSAEKVVDDFHSKTVLMWESTSEVALAIEIYAKRKGVLPKTYAEIRPLMESERLGVQVRPDFHYTWKFVWPDRSAEGLANPIGVHITVTSPGEAPISESYTIENARR